MDIGAFTNPAGRVIRTSMGYHAFLPDPLPRHFPLTDDLALRLSEADRGLGAIAGMATVLPNPALLVAPLSRREAVLSSRIEGTQASVSDVAIFEATGETGPRRASDALEVRNYGSTLAYSIERLQTLPLSLRLVRELHARLLEGVRGQEQTPGAFRTSQNWIGPPSCLLADAAYVPPPPAELMSCLGDWETFLHEPAPLPPLVKCALAHYQFEAIHPFLDGNGRVGRLLIVLLLCEGGFLPVPILYLSAFFEEHRQEYYDLLRAVSEQSAWNEWLSFFLRGVALQSRDAAARCQRLLALQRRYRMQLTDARAAATALRLADELFLSPAVTLASATAKLSVTPITAQRAIDELRRLGIVREITGRRRGRIYLADEVVAAIEERMAPIFGSSE